MSKFSKVLTFLSVVLVMHFTSSAQVVSYDFDANDGGWVIAGANPFLYGASPYSGYLYAKGAGDNYFATTHIGAYVPGTVTSVTSPVIDLSTVVLPVIEFDFFAHSAINATLGADGTVLEYSTDGGTTWITVGTNNDPTPNWYDEELHFAFNNSFGFPVWANYPAWTAASYDLAQVAGESAVQFRFTFKSNINSTPGERVGFGFDNFEIYEGAMAAESAELLAWVYPMDTECALTNSENVQFTVRNNSTVTLNAYEIHISLNGAPFVTEVINPAVVLPGESFVYTSTNTFDLASSGVYTFDVEISDIGNSETYSSNTYSYTGFGITVVAALPWTYSFIIAPDELALVPGSDASVSVTNGYLQFTGGTGAGWLGSSQYTTSTQAFDQFTDNVASAFTCNIDATAATSLELIFDLYQAFGLVDGTGGYKFSWFRVLANGNTMAVFNANEFGNFDWQNVVVDLDAVAGSVFTLSLQASNARTQDLVRLDNLVLREKLNDDLALVEVLSPYATCGDVANTPVSVRVYNPGLDPQTGFQLIYSYVNPLTSLLVVVNEVYVGTINPGEYADFTFATTIDATLINELDLEVYFPADEDFSNNEIVDYQFEIVSIVVENGDYIQNFETNSDYWITEDGNADNKEWMYTILTVPGEPDNRILTVEYLNTDVDDWVYSPCFYFENGTDYKFAFDYGTNFALAANEKNLAIYLVQEQSSGATKVITFDQLLDVYTNNLAVFSSHVFQVPTDGNYYFAFHATGVPTTQFERLFIDNVSVTLFEPSDLAFGSITFDGNLSADACENTTAVEVVVNVENLAGGTLLPGESFVIELTHGLSTYQETVLLSTPLAAGDNVSYTMVTTLDMSANADYSFDFEIIYMAGMIQLDNQLANNTTNRSFSTFGYASNLSITGFANICEGGAPVNLTIDYDQANGDSYSFSIVSDPAENYNATGHIYTPLVGTGADLTLTVEDAFGCETVETFVVIHNTTPSFTLDTEVYLTYSEIVAGYDLEPAAAGTYSWEWETAEMTKDIEVTKYGVYSVTATLGGCSSDASVLVGQRELINLRNGWGYFSSLMDFDNVLTPETDFHTIVDNNLTGGNIIIATSFESSLGGSFTYFPSNDPLFNFTNSGDFMTGLGYQAKMNGSAVLEVKGIPAKPELTILPLTQGYNFIGYLRQTSAAIASEFAGIVSNVLVVKAQDGNVYWPSLSIDLIGNMNPGSAFIVYMTAADDLTYSANSANVNLSSVYPESPVHYIHQMATGSNMTIGIPNSAWTKYPAYGDEVGVFTSNDELVGSAVYTGTNMAIAVYGNDILDSEKAALANGEEFSIKVWNQKDNTEALVSFNVNEGDMVYADNAIVLVDKLTLSGSVLGDAASLSQNIPNPFINNTRIPFYLPEKTRVQILVYNILGEVVADVVNAEFPAGENMVEFNSASLPSGTYFYRMITNELVGTKQMTIKK